MSQSAATGHPGNKIDRMPLFTIMFDGTLEGLAKQGLTGVEWSVFALLVSRSRFENWVAMDQLTLAEELGCTKQQVNKAIKKLRSLDVVQVYKAPDDKRRNIYRLNPAKCWRGNEARWAEAAANVVQFPTHPCS